MQIYHTIDEVLADRRKGIGLNEVIDSLLQSPRVWEPYGETPFSIIPQLYAGDYVDMSTHTWHVALSPEDQMSLARGYQQWYANQCGLEDIYRTFNDGTEIEMVLIPPMQYWMGSEALVLIDKPFWMGKYEVTQEQWLQVMGSNPSHFRDGGNRPVEKVSWMDCQKFCKKTKTNLPKEEQWELACRVGTTTRYNFGDDPEQLKHYAWYDENSDYETHNVGTRGPNAWGLYDMHGNVWEWCQNRDVRSKLNRVCRGGGYETDAFSCKSESRILLDATQTRVIDLGFRVVRSFHRLV